MRASASTRAAGRSGRWWGRDTLSQMQAFVVVMVGKRLLYRELTA